MGKVDDNKFNIDFKHPMSCLQAIPTLTLNLI